MSALSPSWGGLGLWHSDFKSTIYKRSKSSLIRKKEKWAMKSRQLWVSWSPFCDIGVSRQTTMTTAAFWSQRRESNVIKTIMGGCFSFLHKPDLQTSTFSHYRSANIFLRMSQPVLFPKRLHFLDFIGTASLDILGNHGVQEISVNDWLIGQLQPWQWVVLPRPLPRVQVKKNISSFLYFSEFIFQQFSMHKAINETDAPRFLILKGTRGRATQKLC